MKLISSLSLIAFSLMACGGKQKNAEVVSAENASSSSQENSSPVVQQADESNTVSSRKVCQRGLFDPNALKNSCDLWLDGEVLFWQSNMGSLDYGVTSESTTAITHGHVKHPDFNWDWGFRLGLGYKLPHDKWDLFVNYTYVHARAHGSSGDDVIFPTWATAFGSSGTIFANNAHAHWRANLNMADIELGRTCFVSKWLSIRPLIGVRGLVIDQTYHVKYFGGTLAPNDVDNVHLNTDFWGAGLRMGANTLWGLGCGISIYGNGSASLLSGNFHVHEKEKLDVADIDKLRISRRVENGVVAADLALGLQWDYMFSRDRYHFGVKFGWEFDIFFDQNQLFNFLNTTSPGPLSFQDDDLSFQGLTLGLRFDF